MKLGAVILAAGKSSRMAGFKPLMRLEERSLLARSAKLFSAAGCKRIVVVTGYRKQELKAEAASLGIRPVYNKAWESGMFSSVLAALPMLKGLDGFFLHPVDIPLVRPATLELLIKAFDGSSVVRPCRNGRRGHPPLIPAGLLPEIMAHDGEGGLKQLLARLPGTDTPVWDDGVFMDADTPADFARLASHAARRSTGSVTEAEALAALLLSPPGLAHGQAVARIAGILARELNAAGYRLDLDLVHNGALLHDVAKGKPDHAARGAAMMKKLGLPKLAAVVGGHREAAPGRRPEELSEQDIVCLADKLVRGNRFVSLEQRLAEQPLQHSDTAAWQHRQSRLKHALALQRAVEQATSRPISDIIGAAPGDEIDPVRPAGGQDQELHDNIEQPALLRAHSGRRSA